MTGILYCDCILEIREAADHRKTKTKTKTKTKKDQQDARDEY
jgi:hypothetical protein